MKRILSYFVISSALLVGFSASATAIPSITSLSPNVGSVGTEVTIKGRNFSTTTNQITFGSSIAGYHPIATVASADGKILKFTVPASLSNSDGTSYVVQPGEYSVSVSGGPGTPESRLAPFSVPGVVITKPSEAESWKTKSIQSVRWNTTSLAGLRTFMLDFVNLDGTVAATGTPFAAFYTDPVTGERTEILSRSVKVPVMADGSYRVTIKAATKNSKGIETDYYATSTGIVAISANPVSPAISLNYVPGTSVVWQKGTTPVITFSATATGTVNVLLAHGDQIRTVATGTPAVPGTVGSVSPDISKLTAGNYTLSLVLRSGGKSYHSESLPVTISDNQNPSSFSVSCVPDRNAAKTGDLVTWSVSVAPAGTYSYRWKGTDGLSGTGTTTAKSYSDEGTKVASITVTSSAGGTVSDYQCSGSVVVTKKPGPAAYSISLNYDSGASTTLSYTLSQSPAVTYTADAAGAVEIRLIRAGVSHKVFSGTSHSGADNAATLDLSGLTAGAYGLQLSLSVSGVTRPFLSARIPVILRKDGTPAPSAKNAPVITSITPNSGAPGSYSVISGRKFGTASVSVSFNGTSVASATPVQSGTRIALPVPGLAPGVYNVTVANSAGSSAAYQFTILSPGTASDHLKGVVEHLGCDSISGWVCDSAYPNAQVGLYFARDTGTGKIFVNSKQKNSDIKYSPRPDVDAAGVCGSGGGAYGFTFSLPKNAAYLKNGKPHDVLLYADAASVKAVDNGAQSAPLSYYPGVSATLSCGKVADAENADSESATAQVLGAVSSFWDSIWHQ